MSHLVAFEIEDEQLLVAVAQCHRSPMVEHTAAFDYRA